MSEIFVVGFLLPFFFLIALLCGKNTYKHIYEPDIVLGAL